MDRPVLPLTYDKLDQWTLSLQQELIREQFACVIGILRGGAPLALMVSHTIGVQPAFVRYHRATRAVNWDSSIPIPAAGAKVLLCEDIAGEGYTLLDCIEYLRAQGLQVKTLTGGFDDLSRVRPDYGLDGRGYFLLMPWERHAYTESYRAAWQRTRAGTQGCIGPDHEFAVFGIDLDGILLPDLPAHQYQTDLEAALQLRDTLPPFEHLPHAAVAQSKAIITGRPEDDRARTLAWLRKHGYERPHLIMRNPERHDDSLAQVAAYKAEAAIALACTHFLESDPVQAIHIAHHAPLLHVIWWDAARRVGKLVAAQQWDTTELELQ